MATIEDGIPESDEQFLVHLGETASVTGRDLDGLTTLEWLLIVAAVAGLAALAVVLVQTALDGTADEIKDSSARVTAAAIAAFEVSSQADRDASSQPPAAKNYGDWKRHYTHRCEQLTILYGDAIEKINPWFETYGTAGDGDPVVAADIVTGSSIGMAPSPPSNGAVAWCGIY